MPMYCYQCDACKRTEEVWHATAGTQPVTLQCQCGRVMERDYLSEQGGRSFADVGEVRSLAAGVVPSQAADAERQMHQRGIDGVRFDRRTGEAIFKDRHTKLRAIRAMGLHDRDEIRG